MLGTAPHWSQAPIKDKGWEVWGCSPGLLPALPRWDRWYEIHKFSTCAGIWPETYVHSLNKGPGQVYVLDLEQAQIPNAVPFPYSEVKAHFGNDWFLTSSIAWMLAHAIYEHCHGQPIEQLGLWGVDMALEDEEYAEQKPGCLHFITLAKLMGIDILLPKESELLSVGEPYPICWESPEVQRLIQRRDFLEQRLSSLKKEMQLFRDAENQVTGQLGEVKIMLRLHGAARPGSNTPTRIDAPLRGTP